MQPERSDNLHSRNPSSTNLPATKADQPERGEGFGRSTAADSRLAEAKRIGGELVQASKRADRATADLVAALRRRAELRNLLIGTGCIAPKHANRLAGRGPIDRALDHHGLADFATIPLRPAFRSSLASVDERLMTTIRLTLKLAEQ